MNLTWLDVNSLEFPPLSWAQPADSPAAGLLAAGGDLSTKRLAAAYSLGIFPWFSAQQPILWWSPDPRMVLQTANFHLSHSLRKTLRRFTKDVDCELRIDHSFDAVIETCATISRDGQPGTWIVDPMIAAYRAWHRQGAVHSFEVWQEGQLVGGLYGVNIGRMFFGESMFSKRSGASKIALAALVAFCKRNALAWIDCQQRTDYLLSMGAAELPRAQFSAYLQKACLEPPPSQWRFTGDMWDEIL